MDPGRTNSGQQGMQAQGRAFAARTVGRHPGASALALAALVFLVIVLGFYVAHYKAKCAKGAFVPGWRAGALPPRCAPGEIAVTYQGADGSAQTFCRPAAAPGAWAPEDPAPGAGDAGDERLSALVHAEGAL